MSDNIAYATSQSELCGGVLLVPKLCVNNKENLRVKNVLFFAFYRSFFVKFF